MPSPSPPPQPPDLTQVQRGDLSRLWEKTRSLAGSPSKNTSKSKINDHSFRFVARLHFFFQAILNHARDDSAVSTTTERRSQSPTRHLLKGPSQSCLQCFTSLVIKSKTEVRLVEGRHVLSISHEEFLKELDGFELKGISPTDDFTQRHSFGAYLHHRPDEALSTLECAAGLAIASLWRKVQPPLQQASQQMARLDRFLDTCRLVVRFFHVQPHVRMMDIKTGLAYKFVTVKGHVVKARPKRLRIVSADFLCLKCGVSSISHNFTDGRYSSPTQCVTPKCRSRNFSLVRPTARYVNVQEVRLQEAQEENIVHAGRTPRQLEVELLDDLVDTIRPGDVVSVAGTIQAVNSAVAAGKSGKRAMQTSTYKLFLRCHSVTTMSESNGRRDKQEGSRSGSLYTTQQLQSITQLAHADHRFLGLIERRAFPFDLLVRSLCPSIIGHDMVKAGILLGLLGGTPPPVMQGSDKSNTIRSNSHVLVVGDPGLGKSQMLLAASQLASRSVYVGGNTTTTTGLTVTLTKESGGEAGIEAGALVLADQGVCCIDEFDKMDKVHQDGLLEAMEQQQVSIAKAGVVASLPARCSVIAAANPKHGSYNMGKTVAENLNIAPPILSRFDLVFILKDRADKDQDRLVSSNIMNLYRGAEKRSNSDVFAPSGRQTSEGRFYDAENRMPMKDRLKWVAGFQQQPLPAELVRDYISYAREYCKPKLTQEAAAVLQDYFMKLRYPGESLRKDKVPITTRQLEALIRLSQARAKACLREHVLQEDALDVVELMVESVDQVHTDECGELDWSRGGAGGKSKRKMKKEFAKELRNLIGVGAGCTKDDLRRIANKVNCGLEEFPSVVEDLRNDGVLLRKGGGSYEVAS